MARKRAQIHVVAGALFDDEGRVLLAQRPVGKHMAGRWEFPGGKLHANEAAEEGLRRELVEELGVHLEKAEPLIRFRHEYPDRRVLLDVWRVTRYRGEPRSLDSQALAWVEPERLHTVDLLEADRPIITALRLPRIAFWLDGLAALLGAPRLDGPRALLWVPGDCAPSAEDVREAVRVARGCGHKVIVVGEGVEAVVAAAGCGADGMLLAGGARLSVDPTGSFLVGAVCSTRAAAESAAAAGAHYLVLEQAEEADEKQLASDLDRLRVPAFVGWYPDESALEKLRTLGAHGCAVRERPRRE